MKTTTMRPAFGGDLPPEETIGHLLRGDWFLPDPDTPACGAVLYVPPAATNDGTERMFCCDRPADHQLQGEPRHRQVIDLEEGKTSEWTDETCEIMQRIASQGG